MASFCPLSLATLCNQGPENVWIDGRWLWALGQGVAPNDPAQATLQAGLAAFPTGRQTFWGVPFEILDPAANEGRCWLVLGDDQHPSLPRRFEVAVGERAGHVLFCHCADCVPENGGNAPVGDVGELLAEYTLVLANGRRVVQPIRRRFEVNNYRHAWGQLAFGSLPHREHQPYSEVTAHGPGLTGLTGGPGGSSYWLYALPNPEPDQPITRIELASTGRGILVVAGITRCLDAENPLQRTPRTAVRVDFADGGGPATPWDVEVSMDVGTVVKVAPLSDPRGPEWLESPLQGWGAELSQAHRRGPTYVEATGAPSAELTLQTGDGKSVVRWGDVVRHGVAESPDRRVRVQVLHPQPTWVHARVVDEATSRPTPARVHLSGPSGEYLPPYGHQADVNANWCEDVGGDLVLGRMAYAYIPGEFQVELPVGEVYVEVVKGFEYTPIRRKLTIAPGQRELTLRIARWAELKRQGYYSGDTHVHFVNPTASVLEAGGEDLNVTNVLAAQWGRLFTDVENFTGGLAPTSTTEHLVYVSSENRHHVLGHISLLGLKRPVFPLSSGGPGEDYLGGWEEVMLADWCDAAHEQGGLVVAPHFPNPHCELAADIALGKVDAAEIRYFQATHDGYNVAEWYRYLNCGYRLPAVGGTDKMFNTMPVGGVRTYACVGTDRPFSYEAWCDAIRQGRTFTSSGPLIDLRVEGRMVGDTVELPAGGGTVEVQASAACAQPFDRLQIVQGGRVVAETTTDETKRRATLKTKLAVAQSTWLAARCFGDLQVWHVWPVNVYAHTSPIYVSVGGGEVFSPADVLYMLTLIEGGITYLERLSIHRSEEAKRRNLGVLEAGRQALHRRLHEHRVNH